MEPVPATNEIAVEVVYALPDEPFVVELRTPAGTTVGEAIERSGVLARFPQIANTTLQVGVFGHPCERSAVLSDGDRVEIYRPLDADVKTRRRERVAAARKKRANPRPG